MNNKKKLIELIESGKSGAFCDICEGRSDCEDCENERIADHLIANNVTIMERGEWVETVYKTVEYGFVERRGKAWKCTNCLNVSKRFDQYMNFCPNCGADMRKG